MSESVCQKRVPRPKQRSLTPGAQPDADAEGVRTNEKSVPCAEMGQQAGERVADLQARFLIAPNELSVAKRSDEALLAVSNMAFVSSRILCFSPPP